MQYLEYTFNAIIVTFESWNKNSNYLSIIISVKTLNQLSKLAIFFLLFYNKRHEIRIEISESKRENILDSITARWKNSIRTFYPISTILIRLDQTSQIPFTQIDTKLPIRRTRVTFNDVRQIVAFWFNAGRGTRTYRIHRERKLRKEESVFSFLYAFRDRSVDYIVLYASVHSTSSSFRVQVGVNSRDRNRLNSRKENRSKRFSRTSLPFEPINLRRGSCLKMDVTNLLFKITKGNKRVRKFRFFV